MSRQDYWLASFRVISVAALPKALFIEQPGMALGKWVLIFINFLIQLCLFFELQKAILAVTGADSVTLKEKYLDWAYRSVGYKKARAVFKRYSQISIVVLVSPLHTQLLIHRLHVSQIVPKEVIPEAFQQVLFIYFLNSKSKSYLL